MALYRQKGISRGLQIFDLENKPMPAVEVFSVALAYLKKRIMETIKRQKTGVSDDDVFFVITIPAIWSDAARQFMREAATNTKVGITHDQLRLVLEPEAAAVYCVNIESQKRHDCAKSFAPLPVGHRYILVDMGGGTVDIATHEIQENGLLLELHVVRGDNLGGQYFNRKCLEFFKEMVGKDHFEEWGKSHCEDFLDLHRKIEGLKKSVCKTDSNVIFNVDKSLANVYKRSRGTDIDLLTSSGTYSHAVESYKNRKMMLKNKFLKQHLEHVAQGIEEHIKEIVGKIQAIKTIFLVGGLAKSDYIQNFMISKFSEYSLIVPEDPGVAVLKGAVLLGKRPQTIAGRKARYSYGILISVDFVDGTHNGNYKFYHDGKFKCNNIFKKLIKKDQVLKYGERFTAKTWINAKLPETKHKIFATDLYQSTKESPIYTTDEGCTKIGGIRKYPPEEGWPDYCETTHEIVVGEAEFKLNMKDGLGREYKTDVEFL